MTTFFPATFIALLQLDKSIISCLFSTTCDCIKALKDYDDADYNTLLSQRTCHFTGGSFMQNYYARPLGEGVKR